jgi:hypothetical protein
LLLWLSFAAIAAVAAINSIATVNFVIPLMPLLIDAFAAVANIAAFAAIAATVLPLPVASCCCQLLSFITVSCHCRNCCVAIAAAAVKMPSLPSMLLLPSLPFAAVAVVCHHRCYCLPCCC